MLKESGRNARGYCRHLACTAKWSFCRLVIVVLSIVALLLPTQAQVIIPVEDRFVVIPFDLDSSTTPSTTPVINEPSGFDFVLSNQQILTGFPIGHNLPEATNELFYNLLLDGYGGLPPGSCLQRGYLLSDSDPNKAICTANENRDLLRIWANRNPNLKNVLVKNLSIMNAFRTYNVVDGTIVTSSAALPHTDTFQSFYGSSPQEDPDWFVLQDTYIKNSDNSLMISATPFKGAVYQNLQTGCDDHFRQDSKTRNVNDHLVFDPSGTPGGDNPCSNTVSFGSSEVAPLWLIDVQSGGQISVSNGNAQVIVIGDDNRELNINTRNSSNSLVPHPEVRYYSSIEIALLTEERPPYIELSCSGWANPPAGCESRIGFLN